LWGSDIVARFARKQEMGFGKGDTVEEVQGIGRGKGSIYGRGSSQNLQLQG
jgi:hypothetical protein